MLMNGIIKYTPKLVHFEFKDIQDVMGKSQPKIQIARSILNPITKDSVCYIIRPKIENNNKSAVGECVYELKINVDTYNIETIHNICEDAYNWFMTEINTRLKTPIFRDPYLKSDMNDILEELLERPF